MRFLPIKNNIGQFTFSINIYSQFRKSVFSKMIFLRASISDVNNFCFRSETRTKLNDDILDELAMRTGA
ncbi:hypothetical protein HR12_21240 [Microbacterium sp. SUBG005]|nr:hypothetical protein HR12_21240 [Microbacterium sp. SUBG005]